MGVEGFSIVFDQPDKVYYPGQMVTGRVDLHTSSVKKIRGVEIKIKGRAKCKWSDQETYTDSEGKSQTRTIYRKEKQTYIQNETVLCGGRDKFELPVGRHSYPFAVMLPYKAPSSFNGSYGGVLYYAKAKIDIPLGIDKTTEKHIFTVVNLLNLNYFPHLRTPSKTEKDKTFCCCCCASGPLVIIVMLPKTGYATTESIPITLEVDNASNVGVNAVHAYLKRNINWKAEGHHKQETIQLQKLRFGAVEQGQSHTWSENLTIPPTTFPYLEDCSIIQISHELHVEADASGMHADLDMHIPLTIGDIPLSEDPNAAIVNPNPQPQTYPNNVPFTPGMPGPAGMIAPNTNPYGVPGGIPVNPPVPGYPVPGPGYPALQISPPAPQPGMPNPGPNIGFVPPSYPSAGAVPTIPISGYPTQNFTPGGYVIPGQPPNDSNQYPPPSYNPSTPANNFSPPPQPATNPECSQNAPYPAAGCNLNASGDGLGLSSFGSDIKLEKTSFLSDPSKQSNEKDATQFTPLLPSTPSAPPPN